MLDLNESLEPTCSVQVFSLRTLPLYAAGWGRTALLYACTAGVASNNTLIWSSMAVPLSFVYSGSLFDFNRSSSFSKPGNVQCEFHRVRALWLWTYVLESSNKVFSVSVFTLALLRLNYAGCRVWWSFLSHSCHTSGSRRLPLPTLFPQRWGVKRRYARFTWRVKRPSWSAAREIRPRDPPLKVCTSVFES